MTITKYTFYSPNGNDYPVTANADGKLYQMLGNMDYSTYSRQDWSIPTSIGLTKTFVKTSFIIAGRYFEATNHLIQLLPSATNFIHVAIDLSKPLDPVTFTVDTSDQSNTVDINNTSGVYKRLIEKITTNGGAILKTEKVTQNRIFDLTTISNATIEKAKITTLEVTGDTKLKNLNVSGSTQLSTLNVSNTTLLKDTTVSGNLNSTGVVTAKSLTVRESVNVGGSVTIGANVTANNVTAKNNTTTNTLIVKGVKAQRSAQFQTPTTYATITGTALEFFTLYKSANVVTCNFWGSPTSGSIPGGGAIVGWITDNAFKPEYTQNFTVFTANGQRCRFTVDAGGAIRSHEPVGINVEIWDSMQWIVAGTEGGVGN